MSIHVVALAAAIAVSIVFAVAGAIQIMGPRAVREVYCRWNFPQQFRRIVGVLDLVAASLLLWPGMRGYGIALAGIICFGGVVILFEHGNYVYALPAMLLLVALAPAVLAV